MQFDRIASLEKVFLSILQQFSSSLNYLWIYSAFCCFGLVLLFSASSIILSLIPIYIPQQGTTLYITQKQSQPFYIEYTATAIENSTGLYSGFADNLADVTEQVTQQLGLRSNIIDIKQIELIEQTGSGRRRRGEETQNRKNIRKRRATSARLLLSCQANYRSICRSDSCRTNYISKIRQQYFNHPYIVLPLRLISFADQTIQFTLQYVNFTFNTPTGFTIFSSALESEGEWVSIVNPITFSLTTTQSLLNHGGYAIISAGRNPAIPSDVSLSDTIIQQRTDNLTADLTNIFLYTSILGVYDGGSETSFFITLHNDSPDQERSAIMALGNKYNQETIIYVRKKTPTIQQLIYTTGQYRGNYVQGLGYTELFENVTDNYSILQICPNISYRFSLNFNFETMITGRIAIQTRQLIDHHSNNRMINQKRFTF